MSAQPPGGALPLLNGTSKECRLCHRLGSRQFVEAGCEQWECANDRACGRRARLRAARLLEEASHE